MNNGVAGIHLVSELALKMIEYCYTQLLQERAIQYSLST
jgi:hypothetical protein